jgi:hypothetical protein
MTANQLLKDEIMRLRRGLQRIADYGSTSYVQNARNAEVGFERGYSNGLWEAAQMANEFLNPKNSLIKE